MKKTLLKSTSVLIQSVISGCIIAMFIMVMIVACAIAVHNHRPETPILQATLLYLYHMRVPAILAILILSPLVGRHNAKYYRTQKQLNVSSNDGNRND